MKNSDQHKPEQHHEFDRMARPVPFVVGLQHRYDNGQAKQSQGDDLHTGSLSHPEGD